MTGAGSRARPVPARYDRPFWDGLREHRLMLPYCDGCAAYWYPPAPRCPRCLSATAAWREVPGRGTLHSWATAERPFAPGLSTPYTVVQVELDVQPGLLLDSTLADPTTADPTRADSTPRPPLRLGLPVTAVYLDDPRGFTVHAFTPAAPTGATPAAPTGTPA
ncbi:MAG TPA: OB-fold domain-containing protein [Trebonia sp.]